MAENENLSASQATEVTEETAFDPIQAINELKANTVPKEEFQKLLAERDKYLKALIEGDKITAPIEKVDVQQLRNDLFGGGKELNNLDYITKALELREAILDTEGKDIFVADGLKINATEDDYRTAEKVAQALKNCVEVAEGDPEVFDRELTRIVKEPPHAKSKNRR